MQKAFLSILIIVGWWYQMPLIPVFGGKSRLISEFEFQDCQGHTISKQNKQINKKI